MKKYIGLSLLSTLAFANTVTIDGEPKQEKYQSVDKIIIKHADLKNKNLIIMDNNFSKTVVEANQKPEDKATFEIGEAKRVMMYPREFFLFNNNATGYIDFKGVNESQFLLLTKKLDITGDVHIKNKALYKIVMIKDDINSGNYRGNIFIYQKPSQDIPQPKSPHKDNNIYNKTMLELEFYNSKIESNILENVNGKLNSTSLKLNDSSWYIDNTKNKEIDSTFNTALKTLELKNSNVYYKNSEDFIKVYVGSNFKSDGNSTIHMNVGKDGTDQLHLKGTPEGTINIDVVNQAESPDDIKDKVLVYLSDKDEKLKLNPKIDSLFIEGLELKRESHTNNHNTHMFVIRKITPKDPLTDKRVIDAFKFGKGLYELMDYSHDLVFDSSYWYDMGVRRSKVGSDALVSYIGANVGYNKHFKNGFMIGVGAGYGHSQINDKSFNKLSANAIISQSFKDKLIISNRYTYTKLDDFISRYDVDLRADYRFKIGDKSYLIPNVTLSYGHNTKASYMANNGVLVTYSPYDSLVLKYGLISSYKIGKNSELVYDVFGRKEFYGKQNVVITKNKEKVTQDLKNDLHSFGFNLGYKHNFGKLAFSVNTNYKLNKQSQSLGLSTNFDYRF